MKPRTYLIAIFLFSLASWACGSMSASERAASTTTAEPAATTTDANSGEDAALAGARGLFDIAINDNVDAPAGDNTDFKYFDIAERGRVSVRVRFMSPEIAGAVSIHNDFGDVLVEEAVAAGQNEVYIQDFGVLPGRYYVRVFASEGRSDYAIGREFTSSVASATQTTQTSSTSSTPPEEEEPRTHRRRSRRTTTETPAETPTAEAPPPTEAPVAVAEPTPEPAAEEVTIRATILTIRERSGGQGSTLILLGCGSSSGLSEGSRGRVGSTSARAEITRITGSDSCEAESSSSVSEIGSASYVNFTP